VHATQEPTPAISDHADLAGRLHGVARGCDVDQRRLGRRRLLEPEAALDVVVGIAELDARTDAVEQRRHDGDIAVARVAVGDRTHMAVDPEDLLDDDDGALRLALRSGDIGRRAEPVRCPQDDCLAHGSDLPVGMDGGADSAPLRH
jgi:hypothetical protein